MEAKHESVSCLQLLTHLSGSDHMQEKVTCRWMWMVDGFVHLFSPRGV